MPLRTTKYLYILSILFLFSSCAVRVETSVPVSSDRGVSSTVGDGSEPGVELVKVQSNLEVDVTFNEAMGSGVTNASSYEISGTGKGNLSTNPTSVVLISGNKYRL